MAFRGVWFSSLILVAGCGSSVVGSDSGPTDALLADNGGPDDQGPLDIGAEDAPSGVDMGPADDGVFDAGPVDLGPADLGSPDLGPADLGPTDLGPADSGPPDSGPVDLGPPDLGPPDLGPPDTGPNDTGPVDVGAGVCAVPSAPVPLGFYSTTQSVSLCTTFSCVESCSTPTMMTTKTEVTETSAGLLVFDLEAPSGSFFPTYQTWTEISRTQTASALVVTAYGQFGNSCGFTATPGEYGQAVVTMDLSAQTISVAIDCEVHTPNGCALPSERLEVRTVGGYRCLPSEVRCVRDDAVTCDALGTVTSSSACGTCQ